MTTRIPRLRVYLRLFALVVLAMAFAARPVRADNCTACHNVNHCEPANPGESGNTGACTENESGCTWALGDKCTGA